MGCVLNVMCFLEMRNLPKMLIVNLRRKSSFEKPGRRMDQNTTLEFSRSRVWTELNWLWVGAWKVFVVVMSGTIKTDISRPSE